jgi:hypothetical protein
MAEATQPMKLAIGAESLIVPHLERDDMDEVQLITADGQHFALVQQSPVWENAELIVKAVKAQDALVNAATWIVAEFDHYGEVLQLGDGDDDGMYGSTSAIEQLRAALTLARDGATQ